MVVMALKCMIVPRLPFCLPTIQSPVWDFFPPQLSKVFLSLQL